MNIKACVPVFVTAVHHPFTFVKWDCRYRNIRKNEKIVILLKGKETPIASFLRIVYKASMVEFPLKPSEKNRILTG